MPRKQDPPDFETALGNLEQIVEQLEQGDLSLEESLRAYERGVQLGRLCQQALDTAEQRIQILSRTDAETAPEPFAPDAAGQDGADDPA